MRGDAIKEDATAAKAISVAKKALIVTTVSGFVPQFEMNNVCILQSMGYEVHYASNFRNPSYGSDNSRLNGTGIVRHQVDFARSPFQVRENGKAYRQLAQLLKEQQFDLLHCHTPVGAALARIAAGPYQRKGRNKRAKRLKVIYTAHGFHFYKGAPLKYWLLFYPVEWWLAHYTDILITINEEDYMRARRFCRHSKTKVERIAGAGVDISYFSGTDLPEGEREHIRNAVRKKLNVTEDEVVFLSVGELIPRKNHSAAIKVFARLEEETKEEKRARNVSLGSFRYLICGQGVLKEELQRQIDVLGLTGKITLLGYQTDIRALLYAADVFVFPSLQEGMPMALLEAAAAGLPVIVSDIRGNRELIKSLECAESFQDEKGLKRKLKAALTASVQEKYDVTRKAGDAEADAVNSTTSNVSHSMKAYDKHQINKRMQKIYKETET